MTIIPEPPKTDGKDNAHTVVTLLLEMIPGASRIFETIIKPPMTKRYEQWSEDITEIVRELSKRNTIDVNTLSENEIFVTSLLHTTQVAIRNHNSLKRQALKNIIINSALPNAPSEDMQLMFIHLVDIFTGWHLEILNFFNNTRWYERLNYTTDKISLEQLYKDIDNVFPELAQNDKGQFARMLDDLSIYGLVSYPTSTIWSIGIGISLTIHPDKPLTSTLGKEFIKYITFPD